MKTFRLSLWLWLLVSIMSPICAQSASDSLIIRAMRDELMRTANYLVMPGNGLKPTYIRYLLFDKDTTRISSSLGTWYTPPRPAFERVGVVQMLYADRWMRTHLPGVRFDSERYVPLSFPDTSYLAIRRMFWQLSDLEAKGQSGSYSAYLNQLQLSDAAHSAQTNALPSDIVRIPVPAKDYRRAETIEFDPEYWKQLACRLSSLFKGDAVIDSSGVEVVCYRNRFYSVSSEGVVLQIPENHILLLVQARVQLRNGEVDSLRLQFSAKQASLMPSEEELKLHISKMIETLHAMAQAPVLDRSYRAPLLVEGEAVAAHFLNHLMGAWRENVKEPVLATTARPSEKAIGQRVCDAALRITGFGNLSDSVDYEGFPVSEQIPLVQNGVLQRRLTHQFAYSDTLIPAGVSYLSLCHTLKWPDNEIYFPQHTFALDRLEIKSEQGVSHSRMKKMLLKEAKQQGLPYGYILRRMGNQPLLYRISTTSGREELVWNAHVDLPLFFDAIDNELHPTQLFNELDLPVRITAPRCLLIRSVSLKPGLNSGVVSPQLF